MASRPGFASLRFGNQVKTSALNLPLSRQAHLLGEQGIWAMTAVIDLEQLSTMTGADASSQGAEHWADAAHAIKGAARSVGLMALGDACEEAERLGRSGQATQAQAAVALAAVKDRLGDAIEAIAHVEHQLMMKRTFEGVRLV
jgi:HPt (histidine-containing phosphotransfer) domain-containing protein